MKRIPFLSIVILLGDIILLYLALAAMLFFRYGHTNFAYEWTIHKGPFAFIFGVWIIIFYIGGLYERKFLKSDSSLEERILRTMIVAGAVAIGLFYIIPFFGITPKTNLFIHIILTSLLLSGWRILISNIVAESLKMRVLFFGISEEIKTLADYLKKNPHLGYTPIGVVLTDSEVSDTGILPVFHIHQNVNDVIRKKRVTLLVTSPEAHKNETVIRTLYHALPLGISFMNFFSFHEHIANKIPVSLISEHWFLENLAHMKNPFNSIVKRGLDIGLGIAGGITTVALLPFITIAIKLDSPGPLFIHQKRIGKNGTPFTLIKFRSMVAVSPDGLAETAGAQWAKKEDTRITRVGGFLRKTHVDELPQIWNILKGELSVVGPRPERPELVETLEKAIPHYQMRHLVTPGVTGWAQISMPGVYAGSVEETLEKLQYDLYYIKYQSPIFDTAIILKTILLALSRKGR